VSSRAVSNAKKMGWPLKEVTTGIFEAEAPGGYKFYLEDKEQLKQGATHTLALAGVQEGFTSGRLERAERLSGCHFMKQSVFLLFLCYFPSQEGITVRFKLQYICN